MAVAPFSNISDPSDISLGTAISQSTVGHLTNTGFEVTRAGLGDEGADYVAFGSFFPSRTKGSADRVHIEILEEAGEL